MRSGLPRPGGTRATGLAIGIWLLPPFDGSGFLTGVALDRTGPTGDRIKPGLVPGEGADLIDVVGPDLALDGDPLLFLAEVPAVNEGSNGRSGGPALAGWLADVDAEAAGCGFVTG